MSTGSRVVELLSVVGSERLSSGRHEPCRHACSRVVIRITPAGNLRLGADACFASRHQLHQTALRQGVGDQQRTPQGDAVAIHRRLKATADVAKAHGLNGRFRAQPGGPGPFPPGLLTAPPLGQQGQRLPTALSAAGTQKFRCCDGEHVFLRERQFTVPGARSSAWQPQQGEIDFGSSRLRRRIPCHDFDQQIRKGFAENRKAWRQPPGQQRGAETQSKGARSRLTDDAPS